ncbi:MAG: signal peptidase II [Bacilli bacterium]|nr:signal peptidase II [Bacilli bacterium]
MKKILLFSFLGIILDQISKFLISIFMELNTSLPIIDGFFHLTHVQNFGAAFSILDGNRFFFILVALLSLCVIYFVFIKNKTLKKLDILTYSLLIGGILGNLIDRIVLGYVIDFFDFTFGTYAFPVFNIADIMIVSAVILIIYTIIKEEQNGNH